MYRQVLAVGLAIVFGAVSHASDTLLNADASDSTSQIENVFAEDTAGAGFLVPEIDEISHELNVQNVQYTPETDEGLAGSISDALFGYDSFFGNAILFSGVEAYKGPLDISFLNPPANGIPSVGGGFTNSAGLVNGFNTSAPIWNGVRGQFGSSIGVYDLLGRDVGAYRTLTEQQGFLTTGFYKPSDALNDDALSWGLVYDHLWSYQSGFNGTGDFQLGQLRGQVGYAITPKNEVGVWMTTKTLQDTSTRANGTLKPVNQYNAYFKHQWDFGGTAMLYVGALDKYTSGSWIMGNQLNAPLSDNWGVYANSAFMFPQASAGSIGSDLLQWSVSAGLQYSFGGSLRSNSVSGDPRMPMFMVANNSTFKATTSRTGF